MFQILKYVAFLSLIFSNSISIAGSSPEVKDSLKHLDQAERSAEAGDLVNAIIHTKQAKQKAIMHAAKHSMHKSSNRSANQKLSRVHADEVFVNINNAQTLSAKGDKNGTIRAIEETEKHLKQEQKIDSKMK